MKQTTLLILDQQCLYFINLIMWWQAIPSGAVVAMSYVGIYMVVYATNLLFLKNPYKREVESDNDIHQYLRDYRISGNKSPYKQIGLESLSLEEEN